MQNFGLTLESDPSKSFRCQKAANSLDINISEKLRHEFNVEADIKTKYNVGLIVGASGSGKTSLAQEIWGKDCFRDLLDLKQPVIDQFPQETSYENCASMLTGVGLTSVPCWIRPAVTLSNGQRCRAEISLQMAQDADLVVLDEWTSVVDRVVAKVMSHCIQKHARSTDKRIVLLSCHYDVMDWLNPDWVIDCNKQKYLDRRRLRSGFKRPESIQFDIREVDRDSWKYFSKYHYLSARLPGGHIETFGLFLGVDQIGFQCFANYTPHRPGTTEIMHSNRVVIHPDYQGLGLGIRLATISSEIMVKRGYRVMAKFSAAPMLKSRLNHPNWKYLGEKRDHKVGVGGGMQRRSGFRKDVKTFQFEFIPDAKLALDHKSTRQLVWTHNKAKIAAKYDVPLPPGFHRLFKEVADCYYFSAVKSPNPVLRGTTKEMRDLLAGYYAANKIDHTLRASITVVPPAPVTKLDDDKVAIMLTGGKDSVHALLEVLKTTKPENVMGIYIPNINRSESYYEKQAVPNICNKLGVAHHVVDLKNGVKLNRTDHNIALRDQFMVMIALPYIIQFGAKRVMFGLKGAHLPAAMFTSEIEAFDLFEKRLLLDGIEIKVIFHPRGKITELQIIRELFEKSPEILALTSSCYTQLNFRESRNKACQVRNPGVKIYHGCGSCLKCLRVNSALMLYKESGPLLERKKMVREIFDRFVESHYGDDELRVMMKEFKTHGLLASPEKVQKKPHAGEGAGLGSSA